ncbi:MAG: GNAT family N-acetyltransferase [Nitrososphaeraceae archaeon]
MMPKAFPKLFGTLVNLREILINDVQDITLLLMNYNVSKHLWEIPNPYSIDDALEFIKCANRDFNTLKALHFAIESKIIPSSRNNLKFVGTISVKNIDLVNKKADLGYWIGEQYWGRGIATECLKLIIDYAFSAELRLKQLCAYVFPENKASIRVLEKNGMNKIGEVNEYHKLSGRDRTSFIYETILHSDNA